MIIAKLAIAVLFLLSQQQGIFQLFVREISEFSKMAHYKGAASEGNRAAQLLKKREKAKEELERLKQKISEVFIGFKFKQII